MDYLLKASGLVIILFLFYYIFLRNETFFTSIRAFFLVGLLVVLSIPLVEIPVYVESVSSQMETILYTQENMVVPAVEVASIDWIEIVQNIYFLGVLLFGLKFFIQLISLGLLLSKHQLEKINNQYFVETDKNISPFSFFNIIIYNKSQFSLEELEQVINHEKIHVRQWHTLDTILSHLLVIILWFNPFVWLFKTAVQQNLEFLADSQALKLTESQRLYQFTLLKTCTNNYCTQLTNNFYNSFIKKRILMLQKNQSTSKNQWKYALVLPLIAAFVLIFNTKTIAQETEAPEAQEIHEIELVEIQEIEENQEALVEIITKDFKKADLSSLKERLKSEGIQFSFSNLKYNDLNEIVKLSVKIRNENGKASGTWQKENQAIPNIKVGVINGQVIASSSYSKPHTANYTYTVHSDDSSKPTINGINLVRGYKLDDHVGVLDYYKKHEIIEHDEEINHDAPEEKVIHFKKGRKIHITNEISHKDEVHFKIDEHEGEAESHNIIIRHKVDIDQDSIKSPLIIINGNETIDYDLENISPHQIKTIEVVHGKSAKEKHGEKGKDGVIYVTTKEIIQTDKDNITISKSFDISHDSDKKPLIFIDGKESTYEEMKKLNKESIESVDVSKGKKSKDKYGSKADNGVVEITTKKK